MFSPFRKKGSINGTVSIDNMPETKKFSVSVSFFPVENELSNPPVGLESSARENRDSINIKNYKEEIESPFPFKAERKSGYYYLDIRVIAYLERDGKLCAQVEHFFPLEKPINIDSKNEVIVDLNPIWPD